MNTHKSFRAFLVLIVLLLAHSLVRGEPASGTNSLTPGDHTRTLKVDGELRSYAVHIPSQYRADAPAPVLLALHGAAMNGAMMVGFTDLNLTSDKAGFIVVYPSGTGTGPFRTWNAGGFGKRFEERKADDVAFISKLLDELSSIASVDPKRIFACGMSNGGMMCYRLAAELSDRIAAIAPVAGTIAIDDSKPTRPVPVIHFHGTEDPIVPYKRPKADGSAFAKLMDVDGSIQTWVKLNGCKDVPTTEVLSKPGDKLKATRTTYNGGKDGAEVVLIAIEGGGHTWPGKKPPVRFIGKSSLGISANEIMWEFFQRHPMK